MVLRGFSYGISIVDVAGVFSRSFSLFPGGLFYVLFGGFLVACYCRCFEVVLSCFITALYCICNLFIPILRL